MRERERERESNEIPHISKLLSTFITSDSSENKMFSWTTVKMKGIIIRHMKKNSAQKDEASLLQVPFIRYERHSFVPLHFIHD
jgi:hypothetical protein